MRNFIQNAFLDHPQSADETYFEHLAFALKFSGTLFFAAFAALLHAFVPSACEKTASKCICDMHERMQNR